MSFTYPAGILSKTPVTPAGPYAEDAASGVWKLNEVAYWIKQGLWPNASNPAPNDPYFQYVTSLLHGDGTNGGQNNTFLDSSTNAFTITRNGNTTQGSFSPYGSNWGNYLNTSSKLSFGTGSQFAFGTGDYTIEFWVNVQTAPSVYAGVGAWYYGSPTNVALFVNSGMGITLSYAGGALSTSGITLSIGTWYHVAVSRQSGTSTIYVNGVSYASGTPSYNVTSTRAFTVNGDGGSGDPGSFMNAYFSNVRAVNGTAVYTSNFTPSTTPLTAISGTALLTCQSNRFIDNSSNAVSPTITGTPQVTRFSPFAPTYAGQYSASTIGGSGYFDGSGDYLTTSSNTPMGFGTGAFTIEAWVYTGTKSISAGASRTIIGNDGNSYTMQLYIDTSNGYLTFGNTGSTYLQGTSNIANNQWNHVVVVRSGTGSNQTALFVNGVRQAVGTNSQNYTSGTIYLGAFDTANGFWNGYISDLRIVKGSAVYDPSVSTLTVPTAPLTAVTNTALLLNYTNGAIYDNAMIPDYETVGNAQISTSVKKYGTGSLAFDGSGDYLKLGTQTELNFGTGNFTIETWLYIANTTNTDQCIIANGVGSWTTGAIAFKGYNTAYGGVIVLQAYDFNSGGTALVTSAPIQSGNWYHVALSRVGNSFKLFVNGTQQGSAGTFTGNMNFNGNNSTLVGYSNFDGSNGYLNGNLDDLRITKGYARYWENFTPPAAALPNFGGAYQVPTQDPQFNYTTLLLPGNGTNGAQNNTFLDSSTNAFTITRNGNTTQGTFTPFSQTGWGNYFNGSSNLVSQQTSALGLGTSNFTVEAWVYFTGSANTYYLFDYGPTGAPRMSFFVDSSNVLYTYDTGYHSTGLTITPNTWCHVAWVRSGTTVTPYLNGTSGTTYTDSRDLAKSTAWYIGSYAGGSNYLSGYISNFRVSNTARYSSNFTPSATPFTSDASTMLLTCQSNRFIDNSSNAYTLTVNGTPSVQAFSPFAPTAAYSASTVGGSGYFDGSGDYLQSADSSAFALGTGDFTLECWVYPLSLSAGYKYVFNNLSPNGSGNTEWAIAIATATPVFESYNTGYLTSNTALNLNTWNHIAVSRSGTTLSMFVNGVRTATASNSNNFSASNGARVGAYGNGSSYFTGYVSSSRCVKGTAVYNPSSSTCTIPTAPLTAVSNTSLLLNYTNAGITDATAKNDLETVSNAQISTTQSKFGGSSMVFNGSSDYLKLASSPNISFGSGDFTVEAWVYINSTTSYMTLMASYPYHQNGISTVAFRVGTSGTYASWTDGGGTPAASLGGLSWSTGTWYHVAWCRYNGVVTMYRNGQVVGTVSDSTNFSVGGQTIGADFDAGSFYNGYNGYINDFRITKGYARYVQPFTPPAQADQLY